MTLVPMNICPDDYACPSSDYDASPCVYLNDAQVEALGIKTVPAPGTVYQLQARAVVQSVTASAEEPDEVVTEGQAPDIRLTLVLTAIGLAPGAGKSDTEVAASLYG